MSFSKFVVMLVFALSISLCGLATANLSDMIPKVSVSQLSSVLFYSAFFVLSCGTYVSLRFCRNKLFYGFFFVFLSSSLFFYYVMYPGCIASDSAICKWILYAFSVASDFFKFFCSYVIFWQLANAISTKESAKSHYPCLELILEVGGGIFAFLPLFLERSFAISLNENIVLLMTSSIIGMILYQHLSLPTSQYKENAQILQIFKDRRIYFLIFSIVCYYSLIGWVSSVWKINVSSKFVGRDFFHFMFWQSILTFLVSILGALAAIKIFRKCDYRSVFVAIPLVFVVCELFVFLCIKGFLGMYVGLAFVVLIHSMQIFFNVSKNLTYLSFDEGVRFRGLCIVECLGIVIYKILTLFSNFSFLAIGAVCLLATLLWINSSMKIRGTS